jgi:hypothetical protein
MNISPELAYKKNKRRSNALVEGRSEVVALDDSVDRAQEVVAMYIEDKQRNIISPSYCLCE